MNYEYCDSKSFSLSMISFLSVLGPNSHSDQLPLVKEIGVKVDSKGKEPFRRPLRGHVPHVRQQGPLAGVSSPAFARHSLECPLSTVTGSRLSWCGASEWQMPCQDMIA